MFIKSRWTWGLVACLCVSVAWPVNLKSLLSNDYDSFHHAVVIGSLANAPGHWRESHGSQYFQPASCMKVLTGLLALRDLGPQYTYRTTLGWTQPNASSSGLILKMTGDPTLTREDVKALLQPYQGQRFSGAFWIDASLFQMPEWSPGTLVGDTTSGYLSPISAAILDRNAFLLSVAPSRPGSLGRVYVTNADVPVVNQMYTRAREEAGVDVFWDGASIHARGEIGAKQPEVLRRIPTTQTASAVVPMINSILRELDIRCAQGVVMTKNYNALPKVNKVLAEHQSKPLSEIVAKAMKSSDNLVFDTLYLTMLNRHRPGAARWEMGTALMKQLVHQYFGVNLGQAIIQDGSGLSRNNRIRPVDLGNLLQRGYSNPYFVAALARPGEPNSTLAHRGGLPRGTLAKTGTLNSVSCLCGYVQPMARSSKPQVFVTLFTNFVGSSYEMHEMQDQVVRDLAAWTVGGQTG